MQLIRIQFHNMYDSGDYNETKKAISNKHGSSVFVKWM